MTTGDPWECPKCGGTEGQIIHPGPERAVRCRACGKVVELKEFKLDVKLDVGDAEREAIVHVSAVSEIAQAIANTMKPYLLGKVVNPEYKSDVQLKGKIARLEDRITELEKEIDDGDEIRLETIGEKNKANDNLNEALELLWGIVDAVSKKPRHGNVFSRARECLDNLWGWKHKGEFLMLIAEVMCNNVDSPGEYVLGKVTSQKNDNVNMTMALTKIKNMKHPTSCTSEPFDEFCDCFVGVAARALAKEKQNG